MVIFGDNGAVREVRRCFTGVGGQVKSVKEIYAGIDGTTQKVWETYIYVQAEITIAAEIEVNASDTYIEITWDSMGDGVRTVYLEFSIAVDFATMEYTLPSSTPYPTSIIRYINDAKDSIASVRDTLTSNGRKQSLNVRNGALKIYNITISASANSNSLGSGTIKLYTNGGKYNFTPNIRYT